MALQTINIGASANDGSGDPLRTAMGKINDNFQALNLGVFNVKDPAYGAVGNGVADDGNAIRAAINAAIAAGGGVVHLPKGTYLVTSASDALPIGSNVMLRGDGKGASVIQHDDTAADGPIIDSVNGAGIENFHIRGLSLLGNRENDRTVSASQLIIIRDVAGGSIMDCEIAHSRSMGLFLSKCSNFVVQFNDVHHNNADGIACWHYRACDISHNNCWANWDDSISSHTSDGTFTDIIKRDLIVTDNFVRDGKGIRILGAKSLVCTENEITRVHGSGLNVTYDTNFNQGNTPGLVRIVKDNIIMDVFENPLASPASVPVYLRVGGGFRNAGSGNVAAPGENDSVAGAIEELYGANTGNFYADNIDDTTVPSPGGYFGEVSGNICVRTLPAVDNYSDWGYGQFDAGPSGLYDGPITDTNLKATGIEIMEALKYTKIHHNIVYTGSTSLTFAVGSAADDLVFDHLEIDDNIFADSGQQCVEWPTSSVSKQNIKFRRNLCDADPRYVHSNRGTNGNWQADSYPRGFYIPNLSGCVLEDNEFRNCCNPITEGGSVFNEKIANRLYCEPAATGFSTSNRGIGNIPQAGTQYRIFPTAFDQTAATHGTVLNTMVSEASAMPSTGFYVKGHLVWNTNPTIVGTGIIIAWWRATTSNAHVAGTDWFIIKIPCMGSAGEVGAGVASPAGLLHSYKDNTSSLAIFD